MERIKVFIVDDQVLMLDGLKTILECEEDIEVIGTANNGLQALEKIGKLEPDVVLMDIRMPRMNGVECTKMVKEKYPQVIVLILTTFDDDEYIIDALNYGAVGYLLKDISGDKLVQFIRDAYHGNLVIPSNVAVKLVQKMRQDSSEEKKVPSLVSSAPESIPIQKNTRLKEKFHFSDREMEVAAMLAQGFTNSQIAESMYVSTGTVRNYVSSIYSKIGIFDRTNAAIFLKEHAIEI